MDLSRERTLASFCFNIYGPELFTATLLQGKVRQQRVFFLEYGGEWVSLLAWLVYRSDRLIDAHSGLTKSFTFL